MLLFCVNLEKFRRSAIQMHKKKKLQSDVINKQLRKVKRNKLRSLVLFDVCLLDQEDTLLFVFLYVCFL